MVSSSFTSPSYSRVPGLMDRLEELRNRPDLMRQLALLAVVVAAGALLLVLPQPTQDPVTIAALSDDEADETTQDEEASGPSADESGNDWLGRDEPEADSETERFAMIAGLGAASNNVAEFGATSSSSTTSSSSSTTSSTTVPTTDAPTTAAPVTDAPVEDSVADSGSDSDTEAAESGTDDGTTADTDSDTADDAAEQTADSGTDSDDADGEVTPESTESTVPAEPEPAVEEAAPATTTTTAAADNGYVDAGHGVLVPPVLLKIRFCESTDNYTAANPASSARGGYQFLTGSWAAYGHAERYGVSQAHLASPAQQDEAALITWQADGTRPWLASKHCWG